MVELQGDPDDLRELSLSFNQGDVAISREGEKYLLKSSRFEPTLTPEQIQSEAKNIVTLLTGASRLALGSRQPIRVSGAYKERDDGRPPAIYLFLEPAIARAQVGNPTVIIKNTDGSIETYYPADPMKDWISIALTDEAVATAFRIISTAPFDWVNLYRIYEVIDADAGGLDAIAAAGWATKDAIRLFKRTSNHPGALGTEARHGALATQPPPKPMDLSEARSLVSSILHGWLRSKTNCP